MQLSDLLDRPPTVLAALGFDEDRTPTYDLRNEAIVVCGLWSLALKQRLPALANSRGLVRRSKLVRIAKDLESIVLKPHSELQRLLSPKLPGSASLLDADGTAEHPHAVVARLACLDWIRARITGGRKYLAPDQTRLLGRFVWGYLEQTDSFHRFFAARQEGREPNWAEGSRANKSVVVSMGSPMGGVSMASLMRGTGGARGRGRWPRLLVDGKVFAIMAKNRAASHALWLSNERSAQDHAAKPLGELPSHILDAINAMSEWDRPQDRPAMVLQRGRDQRFLLHLAPARYITGVAHLEERRDWLSTRTSLLDALSARHCRNFVPSEEGADWGSWETMEWHLTPLPSGLRRHKAIFALAR